MMHSDDIKDRIEELNKQLDTFESDSSIPRETLEVIRTRAILLNVLALNELNWSFFYTKEELKKINQSLDLLIRTIQRK
jgi:hypothetical protein